MQTPQHGLEKFLLEAEDVIVHVCLSHYILNLLCIVLSFCFFKSGIVMVDWTSSNQIEMYNFPTSIKRFGRFMVGTCNSMLKNCVVGIKWVLVYIIFISL